MTSNRRHLILPRAFCLILAVFIFNSLLAGVFAQSPNLQLESWTISFWPEYDQPSLLVIEEFVLAEDAVLPASVRIPVPLEASVNAVAFPGDTGGLMTLTWESEIIGDAQVIRADVDNRSFTIEFYADVISPPPDRQFDLTLETPYDAASVSLLLRQPAGASDLQTSPALDNTGLDNLGNPQYGLSLGSLAAGDPLTLTVSYTKPDEATSLSKAPATGGTTGEVIVDKESPNWTPWVLGISAGAIAAGVVLFIWAWLRNRAASGSGPRQARRRRSREKNSKIAAPPRKSPATATSEDKFCPNCGVQYRAGDKFCRECGAPRRS